jgi:hypothetical protein
MEQSRNIRAVLYNPQKKLSQIVPPMRSGTSDSFWVVLIRFVLVIRYGLPCFPGQNQLSNVKCISFCLH